MPNQGRQDLVARARRFSVRLLRLIEDLRKHTTLPNRFFENLAAAGTAIGNNLSEAQSSLSRRQMAACYRVALRESRESKHGLEVLRDGEWGDPAEVRWLAQEADEFVAILFVSLKRLDSPPPLD